MEQHGPDTVVYAPVFRFLRAGQRCHAGCQLGASRDRVTDAVQFRREAVHVVNLFRRGGFVDKGAPREPVGRYDGNSLRFPEFSYDVLTEFPQGFCFFIVFQGQHRLPWPTKRAGMCFIIHRLLFLSVFFIKA